MKENSFENEKKNFIFTKISKTSKQTKTIIFLGSKKTGKTSIISQFCKNKFNFNYNSTLGVNFYFQSCETNFGLITFNIWDTNGEEINEKILPENIYFNADAFVICCSYDNKESLNFIRNYFFFIRKFSNSKILIVVNKNDVENKMFNKNDVEKIANENNLNFVEINAKNNFNVDDVFLMLTIGIFNDENYFNFDKIKKNIKIKNDKIEINNNNNNNNNNKKHCC